jgi:NAD dependent epimerase/dehydratase
MTRTVFVTGADGFIGSHLVERLVAEGDRVRALCQYNSFASAGWLDGSPAASDAELCFGDVRDTEQMRVLVADADVVFHLAALIAIPFSYEAPRSFVETNVTGTLNVLEAVRAAGCPMINTSTSEVYGTPETVPITESHPLRGQSPYSASKIGADKMCEAYALSFDVPVTTLRPFNTYGPRQSMRAVIPTILGQMHAGISPIRLGNTSPQRDFTFVSDTVDGFVRMADAQLAPGITVQLGTGTTISVAELVELCGEIVGVTPEVAVDDDRIRPEGSEVDILLSDPSLAAELIGWKPQVLLRDGLAEMSAWMNSQDSPREADVYHR